jgi:hypothetical protein
MLGAVLLAHEDSLCPGCGHPLEESTDPDVDPDNRAGGHRYQVGPPTRCFACTAVAQASAPYLSPAGDSPAAPHPQALHWHSTRTPRRR